MAQSVCLTPLAELEILVSVVDVIGSSKENYRDGW